MQEWYSWTSHVGDERFVHCSEVVPSSEVITCIQLLAGGTQFVHCREVVRSSECPLLEVSLYILAVVIGVLFRELASFQGSGITILVAAVCRRTIDLYCFCAVTMVMQDLEKT